jgi:2-phosphoglycerate kinase
VANLLGIVRVQSTDMLREVMRTMLPARLLPVLHTSSFLAWKALPAVPTGADEQALLVEGYLLQAGLLSVASDAVVNRAVQENVSLALEGVQVHPGFLPHLKTTDDAVVVRAVIAVLKPRRLKERIQGRGTQTQGRRAKRYLENFDAIWRLQSYLLSEADKAGVPIVPNIDVESAVRQLVVLILDELARHVSTDPKKVF